MPAGILDRDVLTFVGRDAERADLFRVWDEAATASARRVTLIGGEPGIGKTRLVAEVASEINQVGGAVAWGRSDPEGFVPHQPVAEVLHQLVSWTGADAALSSVVDRHRATLGWLVPQLAEPGDPGDDDDGARLRLVAACVAVLRAASQAQPLLVVLDDVHWAGAPTISLVRHLLNGVHAHPIVVALAYRDNQAPPSSPLGGLLSDLRRDSGATRFALGPLDVEALGAIVPGDPAAALAATNGNPFLVSELVRHRQGGAVGGAGGLQGALEALEARLARLPEVARKILDTTAVAGAVVDVELLKRVTGQPDDAVVAALDTAVQERVLREVPGAIDRYRFTHALTRDAVLEGLGATRRAVLHQRVGEALESMPERAAAETAFHLIQAGRPDVVHRGAVAALEASRSMTWTTVAGDGAALALRAADELEAIGHPDLVLRAELLASAANSFVVEQDHARFRPAARRAVETARLSGSVRTLAVAAAAQAWYNPTIQEDDTAAADAQDALERLEGDEDQLRSRLHLGLATAGLTSRHHEDATAHARMAIELADRAGTRDERWQSRYMAGLILTGVPDVAPMLRIGDEMQALGREWDDELVVAHGLRYSAVARLQLGQLDEYTSALAWCEAVWRDHGHRFGVALGLHARIQELVLRARYAEAEPLIEVLLADYGDDNFHAAGWAAQLITSRWLEGRLGELESFVAMTAAAYPALHSLKMCHGLALVELDRVEEAEALCRSLAAIPDVLDFDFLYPLRVGWYIELAALTGVVDPQADLLDRLLPYEGQLLLMAAGVSSVGAVDHYLGVAAGELGRVDDARRWLASALDLGQRIRAPRFVERTREAQVRYAV